MSDEATKSDPEAQSALPVLPVWTAERKALIGEWVRKYAGALLLDSYEVAIEFHDKPRSDDECVSADTCANFPYRSGNKINIYPRMLLWDDRAQEDRVIHELIHIVTDPLYDIVHRILVKERFVTWQEVTDRNELVTDHLTSAVVRLVRAATGGGA